MDTPALAACFDDGDFVFKGGISRRQAPNSVFGLDILCFLSELHSMEIKSVRRIQDEKSRQYNDMYPEIWTLE